MSKEILNTRLASARLKRQLREEQNALEDRGEKIKLKIRRAKNGNIEEEDHTDSALALRRFKFSSEKPGTSELVNTRTGRRLMQFNSEVKTGQEARLYNISHPRHRDDED